MIGRLEKSDRPVPRRLALIRRLYLSGLIPTVAYKTLVSRVLEAGGAIAGDVQLDTDRGTVRVDSDDEIGRDVFLYLCYDRNVIGFLRHLFTRLPHGVMMDIGANIGNHSLWLAGSFDEVLGFEPNPAALDYLVVNIARHDNIRLFQVGLSDSPGSASFLSKGEDNLGQAKIVEDPTAGNFEIQLARGDDLLRDNGVDRVDFIKIDAEEHEWEVLNGLAETIGNSQPILLFEYLPQTARKSDGKIEELLTGYTLFALENLPRKEQLRHLAEGVRLSTFDPCQAYTNVLGIPQHQREFVAGMFPGGVWRSPRFFRAPATVSRQQAGSTIGTD